MSARDRLSPGHEEIINESAAQYLRHLRELRAGVLSPRAPVLTRLIDTLETAKRQGSEMSAAAATFNFEDLRGWSQAEAAYLINQWTLGFGSDIAPFIVMGTEEAYSLDDPRELALWNCCCAAIWLSHGNADVVAAIDPWYRPTATAVERPIHINYNDWYDLERGLPDRDGNRRPSGRHTWKLVSEVVADDGESVHDLLAPGIGVLGQRAYQIEVSAHPALHSFEGEANATAERERFLTALLKEFRRSANTLIFHGRPRDPDWGGRRRLAATFLGLAPDELSLTRGQLWDDPAHGYWHWQEHEGKMVVFSRALNGTVRGDYLDAISDLIHHRTSGTKLSGTAPLSAGAKTSVGALGDPGELTISVGGYPPKKSEALSLFAAGHPKTQAVTDLLEQAKVAVEPGFTPIRGPVGLELTLWAPDDRDLGDATNYLGGVGDVLQARRPTTISLDHLGDLATFGLFEDDRQIREIRYNHIVDLSPRYQIRLWRLLSYLAENMMVAHLPTRLTPSG